jgi:hypothetical protein
VTDGGVTEGLSRDRIPPWASFALIRLGLMIFTAFTVLWYPENGAGVPAFAAWGRLSDVFFGTFEHWDGDYFLQVATHGYDSRSAAYMPAFPGLVHIGAWATRSALVAGVLISVASATAGVAYVARIARDLLGSPVAYDSAILLALYPVALVFTAPYSEGLFLLASAGSLYYGTRERLWRAGLLAGLACATRITGLAVVPALLLLVWPTVRRRGVLALAPVLGLPLAALVAVAAYYQHAVGDSLAFVHAKGEWGRHVVALGPLQGTWMSARAAYHGVVDLAGAPSDFSVTSLAAENTIDFIALVAALALTVVVFRRLGAPWGVFSAGLIVIATAAPVTDGGEVLQSLPRYVMVDFPLFIAGASLLQGGSTRRGFTFGLLTALASVACVAFSRKLWVS